LYNLGGFKELKVKADSLADRVRAYPSPQNNKADPEQTFKKALKHFNQFHANQDKRELKRASELLIEVIRHSQDLPEPYICLSYIFFIFKDDKNAIYYLKIAEKLNPALPECIRLRKLYAATFSKTVTGNIVSHEKVNNLLTSFKK
jgi:hypothetical protein